MKSEYAEDLKIKTGTASRNDLISSNAVLDDRRLTKKIILRKGIKENEVTNISNMFDGWGKFLENGKDDNGDYYIVAQFDNETDFLAFLVFIGKVEPVA